MRIITFGLLWALVALGRVHAQEPTYTIKLKLEPDVGRTITTKAIDKDEGSIKIFDNDGKLLSEEKPEGKVTEFQATVIEKDKTGRVTQFVRKYQTVSRTKDGAKKSLSYEGATVLTDRTNGISIGVVGDAKLTAEDLDRLVERASDNQAIHLILKNLAPKQAVKVGESWKLDPKTTLANLAEFVPVLDKTTITATLVKVYKKGTAQFGVVEYQATIPLSKALEYIAFDPPATSVYKGTLDFAIDGSSTERVNDYTEVVKGNGKFDVPERKGRIELNGTSKTRVEVSAEKDDAQARIVPKVTWLAGPKAWAEFVSKEHAFKALFPGKPQVETSKDERGYPTTQYVLGTDSGAVGYIVAVTVFPKDVGNSTDGILKAVESGMNVKEKSAIKMNGFPGRELLLVTGPKEKATTITQRVYVVKDRMYQVLYIESGGKTGDKKKFLDSFQFDDKQKEKDN